MAFPFFGGGPYSRFPSWSRLFKEIAIVTDSDQTDPLVSLDEAKLYCRIIPDTDVTEEDNLLLRMINSAERLVENMAEIAIRPKTVELTLASWPCYQDYMILRLEMPKVTAVNSIKYYDDTDTQVTMNSSLYEVWADRNPPLILISADNVPSLSTKRSRAVTINFSAGESSPPDQTLQCVLALVSFWFQNREAYGKSIVSSENAQGRLFTTLLDSLRWRAYP